MANKRMFTMKIVDSDAFLDMPLSAQCLYFHLNMRADDDGFVDKPKHIMQLIGANNDDLKLLIAKRFILTFEDSGIIVIKHWRMHNTLSSSRYHETEYVDEKSMLKLKRNGAYSLTSGEKIDDTKQIFMSHRQVAHLDEQKTNKRRTKDEQKTNADLDLDKELDLVLDKDKDKDLDNINIISNIKSNLQDSPSNIKENSTYVLQKKSTAPTKHKYGEYKHVLLTDQERDRLFDDYGEQKTLEAITFLDEYIEMKGSKYKNHNLALRKWVFQAVEENKQRHGRASNRANDSRQSQLDYLLNSIQEDEEGG